MYKISQRRYLGNKNSILDFIEEIITTKVGEFDSLCDVFSGTGVVGNHFNKQDKKIISNDLLYSNFVTLNAFLSSEPYDEKKLKELIEKFNAITITEDNYFSRNFGDKYYSLDIARKIGYIREELRQ